MLRDKNQVVNPEQSIDKYPYIPCKACIPDCDGTVIMQKPFLPEATEREIKWINFHLFQVFDKKKFHVPLYSLAMILFIALE